MALSTVSLWLKRVGLGKRSRLEPPEPPNRYERRHPGELVHVDIKKLGRILEAPAIASIGNRRTRQNASRLADRRLGVRPRDGRRPLAARLRRGLADERGRSAVAFLRRALAWFAERGVQVERVMTDNGACYARAPTRQACRELGLRHITTRPYRPRTNGKAERFIQTIINEWAYGRVYGNSAERTAALPAWLTHYNFSRRHGALGHQAPATRLNNLVGNYT